MTNDNKIGTLYALVKFAYCFINIKTILKKSYKV